MNNQESLYPIRTVARLTGINPVTLRAWERRHGLVTPIRSKSGHRVYRDIDVQRIRKIMSLLDQGISIGSVAQVLEGRKDQEKNENKQPAGTDVWSAYQQSMLDAVVKYDDEGLEEVYNDVLALYPIDIITSKLLIPLLVQLGKRWETQEGNSAEEHFFSTYLRNKLGARFNHRNRNTTGPKLLCACIPGEQHEIGLLLFAISAHEYGYQPVLLGANTDLNALPSAVQGSQCDAIVLSASFEPEHNVSIKILKEFMEQVKVPVFFGGALSEAYSQKVKSAGIVPLGKDIREGMAVIEQVILK